MPEINSTSEKSGEAASASIWNWQDNQLTTSAPSESALRLKGCLQGIATGAVSALFFSFGLIGMSYIAAGFGALLFVTALLSPSGAFAVINRGSEKLGYWLGSAMKWMILPLIYYAFFVPFGKLFRPGRRDVLKRYYEPDADTYWSTVDASKQEPDSRRRQF
ncbi:MAG: hypothetical protein P8J68_11665 [Arenicellaceae bacterium]|nr:hypothetical protein [Arenicellaceae bacterium]